VLTFVDMSKLKYLSRSVNTSHRIKPQQPLPQNTGTAIIEAESESDDEDSSPAKIPEEKTPKDIALEVLNEVIELVLESASEFTNTQTIVTNQLLKSNVHKLHKQVFHKVKLATESKPAKTAVDASSELAPFRKSKEPLNSRSFRSAVSKRNSSFLETRTRMSEYLKANEELPEQEAAKESGVTSGLSEAMENTTQHDFVLQQPGESSRYYLACVIYFFDSPMRLKIEIGWNELVRDVIRHIMTLYRKDKSLSANRPLEFPDAPERYSLYFIDDDLNEHAPDYDMGPRNPDEPIGEFQTLAFVLNRRFKES
jgi:hypothetical protein